MCTINNNLYMKIFSIPQVRNVSIVVGSLFLAGMIYFANSTLFGTPRAEAGTTDNISGWIWSSNIGWISLNSVGCDKNVANGFIDVACGGTDTAASPVVNYGVSVDTSLRSSGGVGIFSGDAWSKNVGWITFDAADLSGCPSGTCNAQINWSTGAVTGWARAVANGGGWDGWIKLAKAVGDTGADYGVQISGNKFTGYAWAGDVVGWIDFSPNVDGTAIDSAQLSSPTCVAPNGYDQFNPDPNIIWGSCNPTVSCGAPGYPSDGTTYSTAPGVIVGACTEGGVQTGGTTVVSCGNNATLICPLIVAPPSGTVKTRWWQF